MFIKYTFNIYKVSLDLMLVAKPYLLKITNLVQSSILV
jgi:hypothetical protein